MKLLSLNVLLLFAFASISVAGTWNAECKDTSAVNEYKVVAAFDSLHYGIIGQKTYNISNSIFYYSYFYHTSDAGKSWAEDTLDYSNNYYQFTNLNYITTNSLLAIDSRGYKFSSSDGGIKWLNTKFLPDNYSIRNVVLDINKKTGSAFGGSKLYYTENAWETFKTISLDSTKFNNSKYMIISQFMSNDSTIFLSVFEYAGRKTSLLKSTNGAKDFSVKFLDSSCSGNFYFLQSGKIFASLKKLNDLYSFLKMSDNNGEDWKETLFLKDSKSGALLKSIVKINENQFVGILEQGVGRSSDNGSTWEFESIDGYLNDDGTHQVLSVCTSKDNIQLLLAKNALYKYITSPSAVKENMSQLNRFYPNPVFPGMNQTIEIPQAIDEIKQISIANIYGEEFNIKSFILNSNKITYSVPNDILPGVYFIKVTTNLVPFQIKTIIVK